MNMRIRDLEENDLPAVASLAGKLVRMHHALDALRFIEPRDPEAGYSYWFGRERHNPEVALLVAEEDGRVVGYAYAKLEPKNYYQLIGPHAALHDIYVDETARSHGIGRALVEEVKARMRARGAEQLILNTAAQNDKAQRLFTGTGFRVTMLEMTCDLRES